MATDTPTRRPDFARIHPNEASFSRARKTYRIVDRTVEHHLRSLATSPARDAFATFDVNAPATPSISTLIPFNIRRYSDYICGMLKTKIVPASHGRIEDLLLTVPSSPTQSGQHIVNSRHERHYKALIAGLGNARTYTIVCHPDTTQQIRTWFSSLNNITANIVLSPRFGYSIWGQDAYVALVDDQDTKILCEGVSFPRYEDMTIADDVASQSDTAVLQSYMYFQGGNVLGGPTKTLIGADYVWRNLTRANLETRKKVIEGYKRVFNTDIVVLGGSKSGDYNWLDHGVLSGYGLQPIFHLDMYVTPTGVMGSSGKEIVLLGRPRKAHEVTGKWAEVSDYNDRRFDKFFDETERQLSKHFEVQHLPLFLTKGNLNQPRLQKQFYNLSFNNVVIENYPSESDQVDNPVNTRNVVLTTYAEDSAEFGTDPVIRRELEDAAEEIWANLGFTVHRMDGMEELAFGLGSVHCITKALKRGQWRTDN